jgi:hypothetical protein
MLLIGSRHRRDSCSEAYRFARSGASPSTRRSTAPSRTPLLGFIDRPFADTTVSAPTPAWAVAQTSARDCHVPNAFRSCRSSRLQRFPTQRTDPKTRSFDGLRVCCTPQPAMGFTTFRTPWLGLSAAPRPEGRGPEGRGESSPVANTLRSVPLFGSLRPCRHRASSFRTGSRSPAGVPSRRSSRARFRVATVRCLLVDLRALFHRRVRCVRAPLPVRVRSMLPWALDRLVPDAAARFAPPRHAGRFALRASRFGVPDPNVEGRQGVSALSGSLRPWVRSARRQTA